MSGVRCASSRALSFSWPISALLKSYCDPAWPNRLFARAHSSAKRPNDGQFPHSLALLWDPLVLPLEVRRSGDVASPFLRERLQVVLKFLDRDLRVGGRLLLGLDHLVQILKLRVETRQRRTLFLQTAVCRGGQVSEWESSRRARTRVDRNAAHAHLPRERHCLRRRGGSDSPRTPSQARTAPTTLTDFQFRGDSGYLEDLVARSNRRLQT
ncbi:hypothetical protein BC827DRAFT_831916 [Russula dissimulans]|nr:hypothetical protein BC827DRAFT_831916 [Russula dissimulans]